MAKQTVFPYKGIELFLGIDLFGILHQQLQYFRLFCSQFNLFTGLSILLYLIFIPFLFYFRLISVLFV